MCRERGDAAYWTRREGARREQPLRAELVTPGGVGYTGPMDAIVRLAERRDLEQLGRLGALLVTTHHAFDAHRFFAPRGDVEEGYARFLGQELENPEAVIYVAERSGAAEPDLLGYVYAGLEAPSWKELRDAAGFIHDLVVRPDARGRGLAKLLLERASEWLEQRGAPRVMLWAAEQNGPAQRLFERVGFRRTMVEMTRERRG